MLKVHAMVICHAETNLKTAWRPPTPRPERRVPAGKPPRLPVDGPHCRVPLSPAASCHLLGKPFRKVYLLKCLTGLGLSCFSQSNRWYLCPSYWTGTVLSTSPMGTSGVVNSPVPGATLPHHSPSSPSSRSPAV